MRNRLPDDREGKIHHAVLLPDSGGEIDVYVRMSFYPDTNKIGEIFINASKAGTVVQGLLDGWAIMASTALQYGVPMKVIVDKFEDQSFEPSGRVERVPGMTHCHSLLDLVVRILDRYTPAEILR